jgi:hypothetical protein
MTDGDGMAGLIGAGITGMVGLGVIGAMSHMASDMNDDRPRKKKEGRVRNDNDDLMDLLF